MTGKFTIFDAAINEAKGFPVASAASPDIWRGGIQIMQDAPGTILVVAT